MFVKCANGSCSEPFDSTLGTMVFRVETRTILRVDSGRSAALEPAPEIEYHWLCPECLHIILIPWFDHRGASAIAVARSTTRTVHLMSLDEVRSQRRGEWEKESQRVAAPRAS